MSGFNTREEAKAAVFVFEYIRIFSMVKIKTEMSIDL